MVIDTSALMAILQDEPDANSFTEAIANAAVRRMSIANWVECSTLMESRQRAMGLRDLDRLLDHGRVQLVPVDAEQGRLARDGFCRFGKGRHPAGLNYGDCFAYALASKLKEPLLCKGRDFAQTDISLAPLDTQRLH
jgi:ribonuclease VapC